MFLRLAEVVEKMLNKCKIGQLTTIFLIAAMAVAAAFAGVTPVIVELNGDPAAVRVAQGRLAGDPWSDAQLQSYRSQLQVEQDQLLQELAGQGIAFEVRSVDLTDSDGNAATVEFRYTLVFNGVALLLDESDMSVVESFSQVKKVHPDRVFQPLLDNSVRYIRAPEVYGAAAELTQFDDLREGFEGQGIYISVIDTGVEWHHEMFGGDPSPPRLGIEPAPASTGSLRNHKVAYYLPLADLAAEDGHGHGTHVASTAAGYLGFAPGADGLPLTDDDVPVHGVAPQAKLMAYGVCSDALSAVGSATGAVGGCLTSAIVMGIEDSVSPRTVNGFGKPVAHVINMSLGGSGTPDSPTAAASDNASLMGAVVVAAAGNSGPGQSTVGAPAAGRRVIAVGAATDPGGGSNWSADVLDASAVSENAQGAVIPAVGLPLAAGERSNIRLFPMAGTPAPPSGSMAQRYVFVRGGELLTNWPASANGRIAVVRSGGLPATFAQIANNAAASGAVAVLFISATQNPTAVRAVIPGANISPADGDYLLGLISGSPGVDPANGSISPQPIRLNPLFGTTFEGSMAGFSSRGPVRGLGQVKPDVAAPGVNVLAAMPPASLLGALSGGNYGAISGTSMASPHVAGAAALVRQAHLDWSPDMVRTVLINTATNLRDAEGTPKAEGVESIIDQGGGLIDVYEAVNAQAMMGVLGDGLQTPDILGSHSFGELPVINSRVVHAESATVHLVDLSGQGGFYDLRVANNRELERSGVTVSTSAAGVDLAPGGSASFQVDVSIDGNVLRSSEGPVQVQWVVIAEKSDGQESLRMPFFLQAVDSVAAASSVQTDVYTGTVLVGDTNQTLVPGASFADIPFAVGSDVLEVQAHLSFLEIVDDNVADLDFFLLDAQGEVIASSTNPGGPEWLTAPVQGPATYTYRVTGYLNGPTDFTIVSDQILGGPTPQMLPFVGDFVDLQGRAVDFDGDFTVQWINDGQDGFEVERSTDGQTWQLAAALDGSAGTLDLEDQANGESFFRVRALVPGQIGFFVTPPSNVESLLVDRRTRKRITNKVNTAISNVSFDGSTFQLDLSMTSQSSDTYVPLVELNVIRIQSASGTVEVINADNGGDGKKKQTRALFDYSYQLGSDERFSPGEATGARTLQFADPAAELFTFDVCVSAYKQTGASESGGSGGESEGAEAGGGEAAGPSDDLLDLTEVLRITVNPLTEQVLVELVDLL